jgi:hypothetical protein
MTVTTRKRDTGIQSRGQQQETTHKRRRREEDKLAGSATTL